MHLERPRGRQLEWLGQSQVLIVGLKERQNLPLTFFDVPPRRSYESFRCELGVLPSVSDPVRY